MAEVQSHTDQETIDRLLALIQEELSRNPQHTQEYITNRMRCLAGAVNHVVSFLGKPRERIKISDIAGIDDDFVLYLKTRHFTTKSVKTLVCRLHTLRSSARKIGWSPQLFALAEEWEPVLRAIRCVPGGTLIVKDAIARGISIAAYSERDLDNWQKATLAKGREYAYARNTISRFRRALRESDVGKRFPRLDLRNDKKSGFRLMAEQMPLSLRREIEEILKLMRADAMSGKIRMKNSTEANVHECFEKFCGYAVNVKHMPTPAKLRPLLKKTYINEFAIWLNETAKYPRPAITKIIGTVSNARRLYPSLTHSLFQNALSPLPDEAKSDRKERRRAGEISHSRLERVEKELARKCTESGDLTPEEKAWLCHDELLMKMMTWYPWYPQCVRNCRFSGHSPNLFKGTIPEDGRPFALTPEARALYDANRNELFWQFSFSADETPNRHPASGLMPDYFTTILDDYEKHHKLLTRTTGTETLFLNRNALPMSMETLQKVLGNLTLKWTQKRLAPRAFRGIFAHYWLGEHPDDLENLAQILWMSIPSAFAMYGEELSEPERWKRKKAA
jgi:hypothetical protein